MKKHFKLHKLILSSLVLSFLFAIPSYAAEPFESYSYNFWKDAVRQPYPYVYDKTFDEKDFETKLNFPDDMFYYDDCIYVADTGNSRVLKLDLSGKVLMEIDSAKSKSDSLNEPRGIYVTKKGHLYVADSKNARVVEYDENGEFIREIGRPVTTLIADNVEYKPMKVVVDNDGRIYVIAYGINMGLVEFDRDGNFQGFMGAAEVNVSKFYYIWKNFFSTKEQQERMQTIVPTEYSNIFVDKENFVYATINGLTNTDITAGKDCIRRLNPTGTDVLRRLGPPIVGDLLFSEDSGWSSFKDVAATDYGCYFVLDDANGKIFTYDYDGNSLFIFGKSGIKEGNVQKPVSIVINDDASRVYVLDGVLGNIVSFKITDYGKLVLNAIYLNDTGDSEGSNACWQEVLKRNSNCEMAYVGLGKTFLSEGDYKKAMEYFKLGNSRKYYSKAFYYYRKEVMEKNFGKIMAVIILLVLALVAKKGYSRIKKWVGEVKCTTLKH